MCTKNLDRYCCNIRDIEAERIKELLIRKGFFDPILTSNLIGKSIITLGGAAMNAEDGAVDRPEVQFSIRVLEGVFDFFTDLMTEQPTQITNHKK